MIDRAMIKAPTVAGLPKSGSNPSYSKDIFNMFIPKFQEYIDGKNGKLNTLINELNDDQAFSTVTKIDFKNLSLASNKNVLFIDDANDILLGKRNTGCYKEGYTILSTITIDNPNDFYVTISVDYYLNDKLSFSAIYELEPEELNTFEVEKIITNSEINSVLTVKINTQHSITVTDFENKVKTNFKAADGDGANLYEAFCTIADQKIISSIWNSDWEFAMSLCIGHYIALVNRETQVSFGLGDIAKDTDPRGIESTTVDKKKYEFKHTMLSHDEAKFWQSTEYGRQLITLLRTKAIPTMISVN